MKHSPRSRDNSDIPSSVAQWFMDFIIVQTLTHPWLKNGFENPRFLGFLKPKTSKVQIIGL